MQNLFIIAVRLQYSTMHCTLGIELRIEVRFVPSCAYRHKSKTTRFGFSFRFQFHRAERSSVRCAVAHICAQLTNIFSNIPRIDEGVYKHYLIVGFHSDRKPRTKSNLEQQKFSIFFLKAITLSVIGGAVPPVA